jgi:hypothetical protein
MARGDIFREKAAECEASAVTATTPETRDIYLDLAKKWRDLARQVDTMERKPPEPNAD